MTLENKYPQSALDVVTSQFKPEKIVYSEGYFVIAEGKWVDAPMPVIAIRWHVPGKIGYPNGFGKPQWMRTVIDPGRIQSTGNPILPNAITITMLGDTRNLEVGSWAHDGLDWHMVTYIYGDGTGMISGAGLGKRGSYPLNIGEIQHVDQGRSLMDVWFSEVMNGDVCLWMDPVGHIHVTFKTPSNMIWEQKNPRNVYSSVTLNQSPATGEWVWGEVIPCVFDYMLDNHTLIGRISATDVILIEDDNRVAVDTGKIKERFSQRLNELDLKLIYVRSARQFDQVPDGLDLNYDPVDMPNTKRNFQSDLTTEQEAEVFDGDCSFGCDYFVAI